MGASQFKLSFLLSGAIIGAYLFLKTFIYGKIKIQILTSSLILSAIFFAPTFLWNYSQLIDFNYQNIFSAVPIPLKPEPSLTTLPNASFSAFSPINF